MEDDEYKDNALHIPTTPSMQDCGECGKRATKEKPNLEWRLVGMSGVFCRDCLNKQVADINKNLGSK